MARGQTRCKSPVAHQEWGSGQGRDSGAASATTEGSKEGKAREAGKQAGKKMKASDWSSGKRCNVRKENIWKLQKILDWKKDSSQTEANDKDSSLNLETEKALETLASLREVFERATEDLYEVDKIF